MEKVKYLILGAGPAGLTIANRLLDKGITSFCVLEKEETAGGLCRSKIVDGSPLDIGGGHILDVRRPQVTEYLFRFMPREEWNVFERNSDIAIDDTKKIGYPYEANIWQFSTEEQVKHLLAIANAGCNRGEKKPIQFDEWIVWKLGEKIAAEYMFPYNRKIWSIDLKRLGTYWLEKLPNVSLEETLYSCLEQKPYGTLPGHAQFYYPKNYGFGELWIRMAERIKDYIRYGVHVENLDIDNRCINDTFCGETIINTIPWGAFERATGMPEEIRQAIGRLEYSSVVIEYQPEKVDTEAHWTYFPDESLDYHRILWRSNFCMGSKGFWTETNLKRYKENKKKFHHVNQYAYPLNTIDKPESIKKVLAWAKENDIIGLGRWGEWEHLNTDVTVEHALKLAEEL
ncbi:MAG: protoporphyrinogen/coproporphyrinogen oxidase [Lachnospiraceae bacterium]